MRIEKGRCTLKKRIKNSISMIKIIITWKNYPRPFLPLKNIVYGHQQCCHLLISERKAKATPTHPPHLFGSENFVALSFETTVVSSETANTKLQSFACNSVALLPKKKEYKTRSMVWEEGLPREVIIKYV